MDIKADYNRIEEIGNTVLFKYEELSNELNDLLTIAGNIKSSWNGPDYENFNNKLIEYIKGLNSVTSDIKYIGDNMKKASKTYKESDKEWEQEVNKIDKNEVKYEQ